MSGITLPQALALASEHLRMGRNAEAEALCHRILQAAPEPSDAWHRLGVIAYQAGRMRDALEFFQRALAADPQSVNTRNNVACTLVAVGRWGEAITEFRAVLQEQPGDAEAHSNLADALHRASQHEAAVTECRTALALQPEFAAACNNLGNALHGLRQYDAAIAAYRDALRFQPQFADAQNNLGAVLSDRFDHEAAIAAFRLALQWNPQLVSAHNNLGCALADLGRFDEALASHRRAIEFMPGDASLHSNLIYSLPFIADLDPREIAAEQTRWNERHAGPLRASILPHANDADPLRRLRVGYVSPDFREHPIAFFMAGLLAAHDRTLIETHCYASMSRPDDVTARLRRDAGVWHDVAALSHEALAEKVRADGIDILVDLSMHSAANRLPVFARKPAPVQVSWLAYPGTTGLETIGYRLTDATIEPPAVAAPTGPERPIHLPDAWCCYTPIGPFPEVSDLPAARLGYPTFGSFSKASRLNDRVLRCWAQVAGRIPEARWLILNPGGESRERVRRFFGENAARVEFVNHRPWVEYLDLFARIDLCLDTFPCNGLTATCHALWMGTPVVTLAGSSPVSRAGASILFTVGLPELVAQSEDDYVTFATVLAADASRLAELRATLRDRMRGSALMDAPRFARNMEAAYRRMWREWVTGSE